jgi:hypothetical protein
MATQIRPVRNSVRRRWASGRPAQSSNQLSFMDQAMFLGLRATGQDAVMQVVWIYEHPLDMNGIKRFHHNLGYGLYGRRIECSPLPFGRHRWVSSLGPPPLDIAQCARTRGEVSDWADERAQLPIDPERGPVGHLAVLPLTDGSTAVSVVGSHCLADGVGALFAVYDAVTGNTRDLGYPPPRARTRWRAARADMGQTMKDAPQVLRTVAAAARLAFRRRHELTSSAPPTPHLPVCQDGGRTVVEPNVTVFVDLDAWDLRAEALGGNSYSLVAGYAAKLADHLGRLRADDRAATLIIPVNERVQNDTRANAVSLATVSVDPASVTTDLVSARAAIGQAIKMARESPDEALQLLPLIPFVPKRAVKRVADAAFGFSADLPVSCSNFGELPLEIGRPDGTDAEYVLLRGLDREVTQEVLEERLGLLNVVSGRLGNKISITVGGYQPGGDNSKPRWRELAAKTLAEFGLTGEIV